MRKIIIPILLTLIYTSSANAELSGRQALDNFLTGLHTLQADFQQTIIDSQAGGYQYSSGTFYLSRPGRFRWNYKTPNKQYILADGRSVWLVEEDLEQVTQRSQKSVMKGTPAQLLAGSAALDDEFIVQKRNKQLGMDWLELVPKDEDGQFSVITLGFLENQLTSLEMIDKFGMNTRFAFSNIQRNPQLDQDTFTFIPPEGYDILDQ